MHFWYYVRADMNKDEIKVLEEETSWRFMLCLKCVTQRYVLLECTYAFNVTSELIL